jgi:hypothetical protein
MTTCASIDIEKSGRISGLIHSMYIVRTVQATVTMAHGHNIKGVMVKLIVGSHCAGSSVRTAANEGLSERLSERVCENGSARAEQAEESREVASRGLPTHICRSPRSLPGKSRC